MGLLWDGVVCRPIAKEACLYARSPKTERRYMPRQGIWATYEVDVYQHSVSKQQPERRNIWTKMVEVACQNFS